MNVHEKYLDQVPKTCTKSVTSWPRRVPPVDERADTVLTTGPSQEYDNIIYQVILASDWSILVT